MSQFDANLELVAITTRNFEPRDHWEDVSLDKTEYVMLPKLMKKEKKTTQSGTELQWEVKTGREQNASMTRPYAVETTNHAPTMKQLKLPWRHLRTAWGIDERDIAANRSPSRLVNIMKVKKSGARADLAVLAEGQGWGIPDGPSDDESMHGVKYHIVSSTSEGFNGGIPSGFSEKYGLSTYPDNLKNYTGTYKQITKNDFIRTARKAATKTKFKAPMDVPSYSGGFRRGYYTYLDLVMKLEESLENQNNNLGNDIASKDGMVMFRRNPVEYVPHLDDDTTLYPFYGIDWGVMEFVFLEGEEFKELPPMRKPDSPRVITVPTYASCNLINYNPRNHFVLILN
jgi:hypothetical protein